MESIIFSSTSESPNIEYKTLAFLDQFNYRFRDFSDITLIHLKNYLWKKNKYIFCLPKDSKHSKVPEKISIEYNLPTLNGNNIIIPNSIITVCYAIMIKNQINGIPIKNKYIDYNYVYWNSSIIQKSLDINEEYMIETILIAIQNYGYPLKDISNIEKKINLKSYLIPYSPSSEEYVLAKQNKINKVSISVSENSSETNSVIMPMNKDLFYVKVTNDINHIKYLICKKSVIVLGLIVFEDFIKTKNGLIFYPKNKKKDILGVYNIVLVGYIDIKQYFKFICTFGNNIGNNGIGYIPYEYISDPELTGDIYAIL